MKDKAFSVKGYIINVLNFIAPAFITLIAAEYMRKKTG